MDKLCLHTKNFFFCTQSGKKGARKDVKMIQKLWKEFPYVTLIFLLAIIRVFLGDAFIKTFITM